LARRLVSRDAASPAALVTWRTARRSGGRRRPARQCARRHRPGSPTPRPCSRDPADGRDLHAPGPVAGRLRERGAEACPRACGKHGWRRVLGSTHRRPWHRGASAPAPLQRSPATRGGQSL